MKWLFSYNWNLNQITFEEDSTIESIGTRAFAWGTQITRFDIPVSILEIAPGAFSYMECSARL